jgi:hypothetical protein
MPRFKSENLNGALSVGVNGDLRQILRTRWLIKQSLKISIVLGFVQQEITEPGDRAITMARHRPRPSRTPALHNPQSLH